MEKDFINYKMLEEMKEYYSHCDYSVFADDVRFVNRLIDCYLAYLRLHSEGDEELECMKGLSTLSDKAMTYLDEKGWCNIADAMWILTGNLYIDNDWVGHFYTGFDCAFIRVYMHKHFKMYASDGNKGCSSYYKIPQENDNVDYENAFFVVVEFVICMVAMAQNK